MSDLQFSKDEEIREKQIAADKKKQQALASLATAPKNEKGKVKVWHIKEKKYVFLSAVDAAEGIQLGGISLEPDQEEVTP
jgi:hypothetical protein